MKLLNKLKFLVFFIAFLCYERSYSQTSFNAFESAYDMAIFEFPTLKVEWKEENRLIALKWNKPAQCKPTYYIIERRAGESDEFIEIGNILSHAEDAQTYSFVDENLSSIGTYSYRLKFMIEDEIRYSDLVFIDVNNIQDKAEEVFKYVYPSPDQDSLHVRIISNLELEINGGIYDSQGLKIMDYNSDQVLEIGLNEFAFDISTFDAGHFLLILKIGQENMIEKFSIQ